MGFVEFGLEFGGEVAQSDSGTLAHSPSIHLASGETLGDRHATRQK
jgi:hypothetical protein